VASESRILKEVQLALVSVAHARMFRNNVGMLEDKKGNKVRYGLCVGSSDLVGWKPITITPDMVGSKVAVFTAVEVKSSTGSIRPEQADFLKTVKDSGGFAILARSRDEALDKLGELIDQWQTK